MKYQFIEDHRTVWPAAIQCRVLAVSRSGYYAWRKRPVSGTSPRREELTSCIQAIHARKYHDVYGAPRLQAEREAQGHPCNRKTVAKCMKEAGIKASTLKKFRVTTIVGWSMSECIDSRLVVDALQIAVQRELPDAGLVAHSDRGVQYASDHYQALRKQNDITCSMSRKGNCWDNAPMESFFATLKKELVHRERYQTRSQARQSLFEYIEIFYNRVRRHSNLGYLSPVKFEQAV